MPEPVYCSLLDKNVPARGLTACAIESINQIFRLADETNASPATTIDCFDHQWISNGLDEFSGVVKAGDRMLESRKYWNGARLCERASCGLVPCLPEDFCTWTDKGDADLFQCLSKVGTFRKEAVPWMDRANVRILTDLDQLCYVCEVRWRLQTNRLVGVDGMTWIFGRVNCNSAYL